MENYTRIIGSTSTNIRTPTTGEINQGNVQLTPYESAKNNGYYNEMSQQIGNISEELITLITAAGLTPDATLGQVLEAITNLQNLGDAAGAANTYTSAYATNSSTRYLIKINITNTGASTLNGTAMQKFNGAGVLVALEAGDLQANQNYDLLDNGVSIVVLNPTSLVNATTTASGASLLNNPISISNGTDTDHDIDFTAGNFQFADGSGQAVANALTKQIDATWAAGDAAGGLADALTLSADTTYHCFALSNAAGSSTDFGFDTSITATNLLSDTAVIAAGLIKYKRIASLITNSSSNIINGTYVFNDSGYTFIFTTPITELSMASVATTKTDLTITTPADIYVMAILNANLRDTGSVAVNIFNNGEADSVPAVNISHLYVDGSGTIATNSPQILAFNSLISYRSTVASIINLTIKSYGWTDINL